MIHGKPQSKIHPTHGQIIIEHRSFEPVIDELSKRLTDPKYFESLPHVVDPADLGRDNPFVRVVKIGKKEYVIKNTLGEEGHGQDYHLLRHDFLTHQKAVRSGELKPETYKLKSIKVFGKIGNFLLMEKVDNIELTWEQYEKVITELYDNFLDLTRKNRNVRIPQTEDMIVSGRKENGKYIVYLPYDYH